MAEKVIIPLEVDASGAEKEVKEVKKEIKGATKEQTLFSAATDKVNKAFGKLKGGVRKVIATFKTLKGAIAATGIGLLVIALGSLVTFFTSTQRGADKLSEALAGIGAAVDVVKDRVSLFGESVIKFFKGDTKGAIEGLKGSFKGLGDEIVRESQAAADLKNRLNDLLDAEREFSVQRARNNVLIREAEAAAFDESRSFKERIGLMEEAMRITMQQAEDEEELARQRFEAIKAQNALGESTREDLQREADAEIALINIRAEKARTEKRLASQIKSLKSQNEAAINAEASAEEKSVKAAEDAAQKKIDLAKKVADEKLAQAKREAKIAEDLKNAELAAYGQLAGALSKLAGENKALAVAEALINTKLGVTRALGSAPPPINFISAAAVLAAGLSNIKDIVKTKVPGGGGGASGGGVPAVGSNIAASLPTQTNLSDVVSSVNQSNQEPIRAYVIGQDVTDSQEAQSYLNNQKTL
jgi:hypothetical protein